MKNFKPHIGKNVIETLTLGMYEDARIIYREYVQNAADSIDAAVENKLLANKTNGKINIVINKDYKTISIEDNGTGIKDKNVLSFLGDVANSQKDSSKQKGFRGIGRLGGLGYCKQLIFETSFKGEEKKNIITLNAKLLKEIIDSSSNTDDAATVMGTITSLRKESDNGNTHFFRVTLKNVTNEALLDDKSVVKYLSMVAPIPFDSNFEFKEKIYSFFRSYKRGLDEYDVELNINNQPLYKPYKSIFFKTTKSSINEDAKLLDISCFTVEDENFELVAIGWFGITNKLNYQIPEENIERGIRLRKENITIGDGFTLGKLFGQSRQNLNYIGEVHTFGSGFKPNARRDYFNDSKSTSLLEEKLKEQFAKLGSLTQDSSQLSNRLNDIKKYKKKASEYQEERRSGVLTPRLLDSKEENIKMLKDKAITASRKLESLKQKTFENEILKTVYNNLIGTNDITIDNITYNTALEPITFNITLTRLSIEQKQIVEEIFEIIKENLSLEKAEELKKKIAEKYN